MQERAMDKFERREGLYGFEFREPDKRRTLDRSQRKTFNIKQLWQRNHEILNLAALGHKHVDIANMLGVSEVNVSQTVNSDLGQHKISDIRAERDELTIQKQHKIEELTQKALQIYDEIFNDDSGQCSLKDKKAVADTVILELSGLRVPTKIQSHNVNTTLTQSEIEEFKQRGLAAARESGIIVKDQPCSS